MCDTLKNVREVGREQQHAHHGEDQIHGEPADDAVDCFNIAYVDLDGFGIVLSSSRSSVLDISARARRQAAPAPDAPPVTRRGQPCQPYPPLDRRRDARASPQDRSGAEAHGYKNSSELKYAASAERRMPVARAARAGPRRTCAGVVTRFGIPLAAYPVAGWAGVVARPSRDRARRPPQGPARELQGCPCMASERAVLRSPSRCLVWRSAAGCGADAGRGAPGGGPGRGPPARLLQHPHRRDAAARPIGRTAAIWPDGLREIDYVLRDFRTGEVRAIDPALLDLLHRLAAGRWTTTARSA